MFFLSVHMALAALQPIQLTVNSDSRHTVGFHVWRKSLSCLWWQNVGLCWKAVLLQSSLSKSVFLKDVLSLYDGVDQYQWGFLAVFLCTSEASFPRVNLSVSLTVIPLNGLYEAPGVIFLLYLFFQSFRYFMILSVNVFLMMPHHCFLFLLWLVVFFFLKYRCFKKNPILPLQF